MSVTDEAIVRVKQLIASGELRPGDRLPKEKELAAQLGLSRNSLREAVRALSLIRVLDVRQGDGTYVTSLRPEVLLDALSFAVDLAQDQTIAELFEVRRLLEPAATALAAARVGGDDLAWLADRIERMRKSTSAEGLVQHDLEFHQRIVDVTGNETLASLCRGLSSKTARVRIWRGIVEDGIVEWTCDQHEAILRALRKHDGQLALAAATIHVAEVERWLHRWFQDESAAGP
ncbi:MAG: FadR/GntR family transcriptional regulator [Streptosporangiaceae bacterium]